ncbi:hypothetical protein HIO71_14220 [Chryseobacterium aquaticum]|uniref:Uncharacterized protein n=1 Tax=Chryseobacterium aquaticum TaxID=452084 RepID=A0A848NAH6_9FLAO|nr:MULTISPECIES: hypothetical protein [Chryseobacterium]NMR35339.1 hypothetical protein [Chryseobacterium aquaticum]NRQ47223.1 hypothetical protein [Chryseobacterium sp. C-204]
MSEMSDFKKNYFKHLEDEATAMSKENQNIISAFINFAQSKNIALTEHEFKYTQISGITVNSKNLFLKLNEDIVPDKDGLLDYKYLNSKFKKHVFSSGYFFSDNYIIMADHLFRRAYSLNNGFQPRFIEKFWSIDPSDYDEIKIRLDVDNLKIDIQDSSLLELDTWYGATFNEDVGKISDQVVKLRPSYEFDDFDISSLFGGTYSVDIKWSSSQNIKTFQAEEFKTESINLTIDEELYFPVRYVHAEFDMNTNTFRHFDGAFHFYTEQEYYQRRDSDLNYNKKEYSQIKSRSKKLFKINGQISTETFVDLTSHFFSKNPLVYEYFTGQYPQHIKDILEKIRNKK